MRCDRLCNAFEFNQNGALAETALIHLRWHSTREEAPAGLLERGTSELGISSECFRVVNRTVGRNPVRFGHEKNDSDGWLREITFPQVALRISQHAVTMPECPNLGSASRDREDFHHFNTFAWEEGEVRMVYEQPSGCLLRFGLNDREGSQVVPDVADAPFGD